jgi:2'-deoxynucleoside 5'-phosphate N-hydrolase
VESRSLSEEPTKASIATAPHGKKAGQGARKRSQATLRSGLRRLTPPGGCQRDAQPERFSDRLLASLIVISRSLEPETTRPFGGKGLGPRHTAHGTPSFRSYRLSPVQIYLAAAMTNPGRDLPTVSAILDYLLALGHEVPTHHVASERGREVDLEISERELARRDLAWIASSDALIAEVSAPSHGVGIEVMAARERGLPVLLLVRDGVRVSRLLLGLDGVEVASYVDVGGARAAVRSFAARRLGGSAGGGPKSGQE